MSIEIREANLRREEDAAAFLLLLDAYARDEMGGGRPLSEEVARRLVPALLEHPGAHVLLAWDGARPVGVATCFVAFSTFAARRLLNVHDLGVVPGARGRGIGKQLLSYAESLARSLDCAKLTLEVLEHNERARALYTSFGFRDYELGGASRRTFFLTKRLSP